MSHRKQQVESLLKRVVSDVLTRKLSDPRVIGLVSVTRVEVSPDLHEATVSVSVLPEKRQRKTLSGLRHAAGHIHSLVCKAVQMRVVPHLAFRLDESIKKQDAVFDAIQQGTTGTTRQAEKQGTNDEIRNPQSEIPNSNP